MPHSHRSRRSRSLIHESPRAWEYTPTSEQLPLGLNIVRRSDAQAAIAKYAPTFARELVRAEAVRQARRTVPPAKRAVRRLTSPRGFEPTTMTKVQVAADRFFICAKRAVRREVLFALKPDWMRRRGGRGGSRKRFTAESFLSCVK